MVKVQSGDIDAGAELASLCDGDLAIGAVGIFIGLMRDFNLGDSVSELWLEHYPGMTEKSLEKIEAQACKRWSLKKTLIIHRIGHFNPGDKIVLVAACAEHREDSLQACAFIMDYLKTQSPFWKKEITEHGERWVGEREKDIQAALRWHSSEGVD